VRSFFAASTSAPTPHSHITHTPMQIKQLYPLLLPLLPLLPSSLLGSVDPSTRSKSLSARAAGPRRGDTRGAEGGRGRQTVPRPAHPPVSLPSSSAANCCTSCLLCAACAKRGRVAGGGWCGGGAGRGPESVGGARAPKCPAAPPLSSPSRARARQHAPAPRAPLLSLVHAHTRTTCLARHAGRLPRCRVDERASVSPLLFSLLPPPTWFYATSPGKRSASHFCTSESTYPNGPGPPL
jgi:hypothetical protein